jgi:WD40 repeat protein
MVIMEDGKIMASSRGQFDEYRIRLWDLNTYEHIHVLEGHTNFIKCMIGQGLSQLITVS